MPSKPKKVPDVVRKALAREIKEPQLAELVAHFFHVAGGPKVVAKLLYDEFSAAHPGSLIRQRILDMVLKVTKFTNEKAGPRDDLGNLSEEDLEREMLDVLGSFPGVRTGMEDHGQSEDRRPAAAQPSSELQAEAADQTARAQPTATPEAAG